MSVVKDERKRGGKVRDKEGGFLCACMASCYFVEA